jgi:hypothetical protein
LCCSEDDDRVCGLGLITDGLLADGAIERPLGGDAPQGEEQKEE